MTCKHDFIKVSDAVKARPGAVGMHAGIPGAEVACLHCGQVRKVWADGVVETLIEGELPVRNIKPQAE